MPSVILSHKTHAPVKEYLKKSGYSLVEVPDIPVVYDAVSSHADIFVCRAAGHVFAAPQVSKLLNEAGILHVTCESPAFSYPENIRYNACEAEGLFIHYLKYTDDTLKSFVEKSGLRLINVRQGYTKCSVAQVPGGIITSDKGIVRALSGTKIDVLKIREGHVLLEGFPYGFFGGCTGIIGDKFIVNGDLYTHPDAELINDFVLSHGLEVISFQGLALTDIGSIIEV